MALTGADWHKLGATLDMGNIQEESEMMLRADEHDMGL